MSDSQSAKVEWTVSISTLIKIAAFLLGLWFLYAIRDIIALLFVALILSSIIDPLANWFEVRRIPRAVGVIIVYLVLFVTIGVVVGLLVPPLVREVRDLASNFSSLWERLISSATFFREYAASSGTFSRSIEQGLASLQAVLTSAIGGIFETVVGIFGGVVSFVLILVMTFYMVVQEDGMKRLFKALVPSQYQSFSTSTLGKIQRKITSWIKGQLVLSSSVGLIAFIGLSIIGVNYALVLGIFAALAEFVPYAGPFLGGAVAVFFALTQSVWKGLAVALLFIVLQQLENNILVPKVMQKAVGLNPIFSIVALVAGAKLAGIVGALFAIPVATALDVIVREVLQRSRESS